MLETEAKSIERRPIHTSNNYLLTQKKFNLTAILQSGHFTLDETGLLVAPNGTKYRIPSGPPEGRKPLQPIHATLGVNKSQTPSKPLYTPSEQQDTSRGHHYTFNDPATPVNSFSELNSTMYKTINLHKPSSTEVVSLFQTSTTINPEPIYSDSIDWNVLLLTLIMCSISLACNVGFVAMVAWRLRHRKATVVRLQNTIANRSPDAFTGYKDPNFTFPIGSSNSRIKRDNSREHQNYQTYFKKPSDDSWMGPQQVYSQTLNNRSLAKRDKIHRYLNSQNHVGLCNTHLGDVSTNFRLGVVKCSSSDSSRNVVVSDGALSDTTTGDESNSPGGSGTNSDVVFQLRRGYKNRRSKVPILQRTAEIESSDTASDYGYQNKQSIINKKNRCRSNKVSAMSSVPQEPDENPSSISTSSDSKTIWEQSTNWFTQCYIVCHTLGIHIGLLGSILSLVQLIVICSALSHQLNFRGTRIRGQLAEIICVLSTSLATDTMLCARQYLIAGILLVFWITFSVIYRQSVQSQRFSFDSETKRIPPQHPVPAWPLKPKSGQRCAYTALLHSVPWAIAAGTALFTTFIFPSTSDLRTNDLVNLNIYFGGLESVLKCPNRETAKPLKAILRRSNESVRITSSEHWAPPLLLILAPFLVQVIICLVYSIMLRFGPQRRVEEIQLLTSLNSGHACKSLYAVFTLIFVEFLSCAVPVIWTILIEPLVYPQLIASRHISRLIILHLLLDPWLIFGTFRLPTTHLEWLNTACEKQTYTSFPLDTGPMNLPTTRDHRTKLDTNLSDSMNSSTDGRTHGVLNCLPVFNRLPTLETTTTNTLIDKPTSQSLFMQCLQPPGLIVSRLDDLDCTPLSRISTQAGYLLPFGNPSLPNTPSPICVSSVYPLQKQNDQYSADVGVVTDQTSVHEILPQLCQHHQQMIDQHYQHNPGRQSNCFGTVPRLQTENRNSILIPTTGVILVTPNTKCPPNEINGELSQLTPDSEQNPTPESDVNVTTTQRRSTGKSTATAVVMAAAAAAVAAQAGTMGRTSQEKADACGSCGPPNSRE